MDSFGSSKKSEYFSITDENNNKNNKNNNKNTQKNPSHETTADLTPQSDQSSQNIPLSNPLPHHNRSVPTSPYSSPQYDRSNYHPTHSNIPLNAAPQPRPHSISITPQPPHHSNNPPHSNPYLFNPAPSYTSSPPQPTLGAYIGQYQGNSPPQVHQAVQPGHKNQNNSTNPPQPRRSTQRDSRNSITNGPYEVRDERNRQNSQNNQNALLPPTTQPPPPNPHTQQPSRSNNPEPLNNTSNSNITPIGRDNETSNDHINSSTQIQNQTHPKKSAQFVPQFIQNDTAPPRPPSPFLSRNNSGNVNVPIPELNPPKLILDFPPHDSTFPISHVIATLSSPKSHTRNTPPAHSSVAQLYLTSHLCIHC